MPNINAVSVLLLIAFTIPTGVPAQTKPAEASKSAAALAFINDYVVHCSRQNAATGTKSTSKWIAENPLLTADFKKKYKELVEEAERAEPESGLGFDPIFDAQDFPDEGFKLLRFDDAEYLIVNGKDWPEFTTVMKVRFLQGKWMVDGAGVVNVPLAKQRSK